MTAKTNRALRKKLYVDKKDASQLYTKEYRESNNAIRESQKQYYEQNKDVMKLFVRKHYEQMIRIKMLRN